MRNYTEANLFNVGNNIVCLFYKRPKKIESFREHPEKNDRAHMNESSWNSVLAVIRGPLYKHSWKPAHRRNKDKHSCQPPATLFKYHHTFLLHESSYIHAKWLADWWLPQRLLMPVCRFACQLWGLEAAHEKLRQYLPHGFITLFDNIKQTTRKIPSNHFLLIFCFKIQSTDSIMFAFCCFFW